MGCGRSGVEVSSDVVVAVVVVVCLCVMEECNGAVAEGVRVYW